MLKRILIWQLAALVIVSAALPANAQIGGGPVTEQAEIQKYKGAQSSAEWTGGLQFGTRGVLLKTTSTRARAGDILRHRSGTIPFQVNTISFDYFQYRFPLKLSTQPRLVLRYRDQNGATVYTTREASEITKGSSRSPVGTLFHCSLKNPFPEFTLVGAAVVARAESNKNGARFLVLNFVLNNGEREKEQDFEILVERNDPPIDQILNQ